MAARTIEAIYAGGALHPTEPLPLAEGEHVTLAILSDRVRSEQDRLLASWDDSLGPLPLLPNGDLDEEALQRELDEATRGLPPVSDLIIEERRNGP